MVHLVAATKTSCDPEFSVNGNCYEDFRSLISSKALIGLEAGLEDTLMVH